MDNQEQFFVAVLLGANTFIIATITLLMYFWEGAALIAGIITTLIYSFFTYKARKAYKRGETKSASSQD